MSEAAYLVHVFKVYTCFAINVLNVSWFQSTRNAIHIYSTYTYKYLISIFLGHCQFTDHISLS